MRVQLDRIAGDPEDLSNRVVLDGELARHRTNLAGLEAEQKRLVVSVVECIESVCGVT